MSGSNLPPGVTESMIPGNRPEDFADEAFLGALEDRLAAAGLGVDLDDEAIAKAIEIAKELAYAAGYADAEADAAMIEGAREEEEDRALLDRDLRDDALLDAEIEDRLSGGGGDVE